MKKQNKWKLLVSNLILIETAMMETLIARTTAWEEEATKPFMYDGVCGHL